MYTCSNWSHMLYITTCLKIMNLCHDPFQIDAHVGNVSDLAFSQPDKQLYIITCGDDKTIKVFFFLLDTLDEKI